MKRSENEPLAWKRSLNVCSAHEPCVSGSCSIMYVAMTPAAQSETCRPFANNRARIVHAGQHEGMLGWPRSRPAATVAVVSTGPPGGVVVGSVVRWRPMPS